MESVVFISRAFFCKWYASMRAVERGRKPVAMKGGISGEGRLGRFGYWAYSEGELREAGQKAIGKPQRLTNG